jgi:hypothetical protein
MNQVDRFVFHELGKKYRHFVNKQFRDIGNLVNTPGTFRDEQVRDFMNQVYRFVFRELGNNDFDAGNIYCITRAIGKGGP